MEDLRYTVYSLLQEKLQNAEDAKASELTFVLDERRFGAVSGPAAACEGPALLVQNDGVFSDVDWKNIQQTQQSEKLANAEQIGRFGLGFISVYHLTGKERQRKSEST